MSENRPAASEPITPKSIDGYIPKMADDIRSYTYGQAEIWRQLPWLALQADGKNGYSGFYGKLYWHGLLHIRNRSTTGLFGVFVDCGNGALLDQLGEVDVNRTARSKDIVEAWLENSQLFDAQHYLDQLGAHAQAPHNHPSESEESAQGWRESVIQQTGLAPVFTRSLGGLIVAQEPISF